MRTLIDIQDGLLEALMKEANTSVKKDAIVLAIKTFLDVRRRTGVVEIGEMLK